MHGKNKCRILKEIRRKIAEENDIPLVTKECSYQGECSGTCPRCESELRYLEQQLARRQSLGKAVTVAALSLSLMTGTAGCVQVEVLEGDVAYTVPSSEDTGAPETSGPETGLPSWEESNPKTESFTELLGEIASESTDESLIVELDGDVAYVPQEDPELPQSQDSSPGESGND